MSADLMTLRRRLDLAGARRTALTDQRADNARRIDDRQRDVLAADVALFAVRSLRDAAAERVQQRLTNLVTEGLRVVFADPSVALTVNTLERRGVIEADLVLTSGDLATDPLDGNGGGLVAVVATVLRLVMVRMLTRRGIAPLLILDEPLAALSEGHRPAMADTLQEVAASLGIQVIIVSHESEFARGRIYQVRWADRADRRAEVVLLEDGDV